MMLTLQSIVVFDDQLKPVWSRAMQDLLPSTSEYENPSTAERAELCVEISFRRVLQGPKIGTAQ